MAKKLLIRISHGTVKAYIATFTISIHVLFVYGAVGKCCESTRNFNVPHETKINKYDENERGAEFKFQVSLYGFSQLCDSN